MTDLTEQLKKGELPSGMYYIEFKDGDISKDVYTFGSWGNINEHFLKQVLAEVPDFVEWKNMVNCACEEHEANKHLIEENAQLKERVSKLEKMQYSYTPEEWNTMLRTVNRTKELLKECLEVLKMVAGETIDFPRTVDECIDKINQVLGEDK